MKPFVLLIEDKYGQSEYIFRAS